MKKKISMIAAIVIGAAVLGIGIYQSDAVHGEPDLSQEEVRDIVKSQYPGEITEIILESGAQTAVYEVKLEYDGNGYTLRIDGNNGEVLDMQEEELPEPREKDGTNDASSDQNRSNSEQEDAQEQQEPEKEDEQEKEDETPSGERSTIDTEEARNIALNEFDGIVTSLELDEEDGRLIYEIEIERGDHEAEIEIDAFTGEILVISIDIDD
ncbi:PepSY domain-containing protein [Virgibacillus kimchii]